MVIAVVASGMFAGTLAAVTLWSSGWSFLLALLAYSLCGALTVGMAIGAMAVRPILAERRAARHRPAPATGN